LVRIAARVKTSAFIL